MVNTPVQTRREGKKKKTGARASNKNLEIWLVKEMTFACFILP
jgi:hypothetical protein